ncbi:DUF4097 family beta strand repeat-containing protein [Nesterenkonia populi]
MSTARTRPPTTPRAVRNWVNLGGTFTALLFFAASCAALIVTPQGLSPVRGEGGAGASHFETASPAAAQLGGHDVEMQVWEQAAGVSAEWAYSGTCPASLVDRPERGFDGDPEATDGRMFTMDAYFHSPDEADGRGCTASFDVALPPGTAVSTHADRGSQSVSGLSGSVEMRSESAPMTATSLTGRLSARSSSGSITGKELETASVEARTAGGDIRLELAEPGDVEVSTGSGNVTLVLPEEASFRTDIETEQGEVYSRLEDNPEAEHLIEVSSVSGDVTVLRQ